MILGYKMYWPWGGFTNFAKKILLGTKKHSLRIDENNRWRAGMKIQHAHGVRTKRYMMFLKGECKSTQQIKIERHDGILNDDYYVYRVVIKGIQFVMGFKVTVDDKVLIRETVDLLAANDGFDSTIDFFDWFWDGFEGKIIHFTDLKY